MILVGHFCKQCYCHAKVPGIDSCNITQLCACGGTTSRGGCTQMVGYAADSVSGTGCVCHLDSAQLFGTTAMLPQRVPSFLTHMQCLPPSQHTSQFDTRRCWQHGTGCIVCVGFVQVSVFVCYLKWVPAKPHVYVSGVVA